MNLPLYCFGTTVPRSLYELDEVRPLRLCEHQPFIFLRRYTKVLENARIMDFNLEGSCLEVVSNRNQVTGFYFASFHFIFGAPRLTCSSLRHVRQFLHGSPEIVGAEVRVNPAHRSALVSDDLPCQCIADASAIHQARGINFDHAVSLSPERICHTPNWIHPPGHTR